MKSNVERLDDEILGAIRQNLGADNENDKLYDATINKMSPEQLFKAWCNWEGLLGTYYMALPVVMHNIFDTLGEDIESELYFNATHKTAMATFPCTHCGQDIVVILGDSCTCRCGTTYNVDVRIYKEQSS